MNLQETVVALHATKLPRLRQRQLTREAAHAPSDAARAILVSRARYEAQRSTEEHFATVRADMLARWENAREREGYEPPPVVPKPRPREFPEARPVVVTWTAPSKPDIIRPERRSEIVGANRSVRVKATRTPGPKAVPDEILQAVKVTEPAKPKKSPHADQSPVSLPEGKEHGLQSYRDYACRCHVCREGKRASRTPTGTRAPNGTIPECGTLAGYWKKKCRCEPCRTVASEYTRARYAARKAQKEENTA
ncbi:hypothetical protein CHE218_01170 [Microbacterium sp. che218]